MTYCDFKPGDEVVCVGSDPSGQLSTVIGHVYTISRMAWDGLACHECGSTGVCDIVEHPIAHLNLAYCVCHFRKAQRRDLSAWLETAAKNTDALDKPRRAPAPKKERA